MKTKLSLTFIALCLHFTLFSNVVVPFWEEDFNNGIPFDWDASDTSNSPVLWEQCNAFDFCSIDFLNSINLFTEDRFESASFDNGYVYIFPFESGGAVEEHSSVLTTQSIDCSNQSSVFLTFYTYIAAKNSSPEAAAIVEVRNASTGDWIPFTVFPNLDQSNVEFDPLFNGSNDLRINSHNAQFVCLDISSVAMEEEDVQIRWRWTWTGNQEYTWLIDDVELLDENPLHTNAIWGTLPGEGDFDGGLNDWTVSTNFGCNFTWSEDGLVDYPDADEKADGYGCSCTLTNGVALINGLCSPNISNYFAQLISPTIDLTNAAPDRKLGLLFNQSGAVGNNDPSNDLTVNSLMISIDGGLNFIDTVLLNRVEAFEKKYCKNTLVPLPDEVIGASNVVIKFVFSGSSFYWIIDDVRIIELYEHDLRISEDYYAIAANYSTPAALIQPMYFAAEVQNIGNSAEPESSLFAYVINNASKDTVFMDTLILGNIEVDGYSMDTTFTKSFVPEPNQNYTGYYRVSGLFEEERTEDNLVAFEFNTIGETISKNKSPFSINSGFAPAGFNVRYEIGNSFYIPSGAEVAAKSMSFAVANATILSDPDNGSLEVGIKLYEWRKGNSVGDENQDGLANLEEYDILSASFHTIENTALREVINIPFVSPVQLKEDTYYFVTVDYNDPAVISYQEIPFFIAASEELNYGAMYSLTVEKGMPQYTSMLRGAGQTDFEVNSWGLLRTPFINLEIGGVTSLEDQVVEMVPITLFPNPAADKIYIDFPNELIGHTIACEIYDICGHLVWRRQNVKGIVSQLPIDVSQLDNGLYNLRIITDNKLSVDRFVINRL